MKTKLMFLTLLIISSKLFAQTFQSALDDKTIEISIKNENGIIHYTKKNMGLNKDGLVPHFYNTTELSLSLDSTKQKLLIPADDNLWLISFDEQEVISLNKSIHSEVSCENVYFCTVNHEGGCHFNAQWACACADGSSNACIMRTCPSWDFSPSATVAFRGGAILVHGSMVILDQNPLGDGNFSEGGEFISQLSSNHTVQVRILMEGETAHISYSDVSPTTGLFSTFYNQTGIEPLYTDNIMHIPVPNAKICWFVPFDKNFKPTLMSNGDSSECCGICNAQQGGGDCNWYPAGRCMFCGCRDLSTSGCRGIYHPDINVNNNSSPIPGGGIFIKANNVVID